jgi:hypothetical protein
MTARPVLPRRAALALLPALTACGTTRVPPLSQGPRGRVLVLRGLFNIFSTGMTQLTLKLRDAGYDATVHNHAEWRGLADRAAAAALAGTLPRPLAVAGHSFGADDAIQLAGRLGAAGVPVDLLVTFDPAWILAVPRGPRRVLNFHQDRDTFERRLAPGAGFDGVIENRLVEGESHLSIDKTPELHRITLAALEETRGAVAAASRPTGTTTPRASGADASRAVSGMPSASGGNPPRASGANVPRASGATPLQQPPAPPVRAGR